MTQGIVDILLPVFNGGPTITAAIESVQRQTVDRLRIIVIDDGSTDNTAELLAALAAQDKRITVLTRPNGGIVDALNAGLRLCQAEFVARQDADDISDPLRLAEQLAYLQGHGDSVAVSGAVRHIDEEGRTLGKIQHFRSPDCADPRWAPSREPYLVHPFVMVRRSDLEAVGGYRYVHHSEDTDLCWRLLERGRLHNLDTPLGDYRMHSGSISGGSIVNGRIMALSSQLAGLSAMRRRAGRVDVEFKKEALASYQRARTLSEVYKLGSRQLDPAEARYLRIALAGKLLELATYRPYELEFDDCVFIRSALRDLQGLSRANVRELRRLQAGASARLLRKGLFKEVATLTPPVLGLSVVARLAHTALPKPMGQFISRARQNPSN